MIGYIIYPYSQQLLTKLQLQQVIFYHEFHACSLVFPGTGDNRFQINEDLPSSAVELQVKKKASLHDASDLLKPSVIPFCLEIVDCDFFPRYACAVLGEGPTTEPRGWRSEDGSSAVLHVQEDWQERLQGYTRQMCSKGAFITNSLSGFHSEIFSE